MVKGLMESCGDQQITLRFELSFLLTSILERWTRIFVFRNWYGMWGMASNWCDVRSQETDFSNLKHAALWWQGNQNRKKREGYFCTHSRCMGKISNPEEALQPWPIAHGGWATYSWRGRGCFLQYLPSKTDKYGLKVFWCADAETIYPLTSKPYFGKIARSHQINLGRNTALELVQPFFGTGRNLTCDNFFTDMELTKQLTAAKMTVVGTLRRNKTFIPPEFQIP